MKVSCFKNRDKNKNMRVSFSPTGEALVRGIFTEALLW